MEKNVPTVVELVQSAFAHLEDLNYSKNSLEHYHRSWARLIKFCEEHDIKELTHDVANKLLASQNIALLGDSSPDRPGKRSHLPRALRVLLEFSKNGAFSRRYKKEVSELNEYFEDIYRQYIRYCTEEHICSPRTIRIRQKDARIFMDFAWQNGIDSVHSLSSQLIQSFFRSLLNYAPKTVALKASNLRNFLQFLILKHNVSAKLISAVPTIRTIERTRIPDVWPKDSVEKLLNVIDRKSPLGKRDYAILLLAARLGLRSGDIRELRLEHIDWQNAVIAFPQQKTSELLELPLCEDVGNAIIDYLRYARPKSSERIIFLRHHAPFRPFGPNNNLHEIISRHRRAAGIELPKECRVGLHSLRHTIATRLHEANIPLSSIASILGHMSVSSTRYYAKANIELLRSAALEVEV